MRLDLDEVFKISEARQKQARQKQARQKQEEQKQEEQKQAIEPQDVLKVKHISMNETQMACIIEHQVIMQGEEDTVKHEEKRYS
jgi:hypothetical protein